MQDCEAKIDQNSTDHSSNQTPKTGQMCCLSGTPAPFSHQTASRGNPCPYLQHQPRLKQWTDRKKLMLCSTNPPTQSATTTKSLFNEAAVMVWSDSHCEDATLELLGVALLKGISLVIINEGKLLFPTQHILFCRHI